MAGECQLAGEAATMVAGMILIGAIPGIALMAAMDITTPTGDGVAVATMVTIATGTVFITATTTDQVAIMAMVDAM